MENLTPFEAALLLCYIAKDVDAVERFCKFIRSENFDLEESLTYSREIVHKLNQIVNLA